jgi:hypothetical protein
LRQPEDPQARLFEAPGKRFEFRADASILVSGHTDSLYDHRRLYRFDGERYREVPQAFRFVGVAATAKASLPLRAAAGNSGAILLTLAPGSAFTILLNATAHEDEGGEDPDYLVRTEDGLIGWAHLPAHADGTTDAEGLFFAGD